MDKSVSNNAVNESALNEDLKGYMNNNQQNIESKAESIGTIAIDWEGVENSLKINSGSGKPGDTGNGASDTGDEIMDVFHLKCDTGDIDDVIQDCFVGELRNVYQGQMEKLDEVEQNNSEYRTYAEDVYFETSEHTSQMVDSLNEANTQTTANIENCIDELKQSRLEINDRNVNMLERFTEALPYTRVGSQDNVAVYDFIVNPVISGTTGEAVPAADMADAVKTVSLKTLLVTVLGIGSAASFAGVLFGVFGQRRKPKGGNGKTY